MSLGLVGGEWALSSLWEGSGLCPHPFTGVLLGNLLPDAGTIAAAVPGDPVRTGGQ